MKTRLLALCSAVALSALPLSGSAVAADGAALYGTNCGICHQSGGIGVPGQFPTLKGRVDKIASTPEGKSYLAHVVLSGLTGPITAGGASYAGYMPSFTAQGDEQIAAILTYVASLGDTKPAPAFTSDDIKAARAKPASGPTLLAERKALEEKKQIP